MSGFAEYAASIWIVLDYPLFKLGKSTITLWAIALNLLLLISFFVITARLKAWLLTSLSQKKGVNVSNWRAAITLGFRDWSCWNFADHRSRS